MVALGPWAREIARSRERLGLSQTQFASLIGVSQPLVSEWERGRKVPSDDLKAVLVLRAGIDPKDVVPDWLRGVVADAGAA